MAVLGSAVCLVTPSRDGIHPGPQRPVRAVNCIARSGTVGCRGFFNGMFVSCVCLGLSRQSDHARRALSRRAHQPRSRRRPPGLLPRVGSSARRSPSLKLTANACTTCARPHRDAASAALSTLVFGRSPLCRQQPWSVPSGWDPVRWRSVWAFVRMGLVSGAAGEEGVAVDVERACFGFADCTAEGVDGRSDGDLLET